jgi:hypothetical protein
MMQAIGALCVAALGTRNYTSFSLSSFSRVCGPWSPLTSESIGLNRQSGARVFFQYDNASKATYAISDVEIPDWIMGVLPAALIAYIVFLSTFQYSLANDK